MAAIPVIRVLTGLHPYHDQYYRFTLYGDESIRIERPWCCLIRRCEMETLEETNWLLHKHLIWLVETRTITDKHHSHG